MKSVKSHFSEKRWSTNSRKIEYLCGNCKKEAIFFKEVLRLFSVWSLLSQEGTVNGAEKVLAKWTTQHVFFYKLAILALTYVVTTKYDWLQLHYYLLNWTTTRPQKHVGPIFHASLRWLAAVLTSFSLLLYTFCNGKYSINIK